MDGFFELELSARDAESRRGNVKGFASYSNFNATMYCVKNTKLFRLMQLQELLQILQSFATCNKLNSRKIEL
jgi:hypothetical protein